MIDSQKLFINGIFCHFFLNKIRIILRICDSVINWRQSQIMDFQLHHNLFVSTHILNEPFFVVAAAWNLHDLLQSTIGLYFHHKNQCSIIERVLKNEGKGNQTIKFYMIFANPAAFFEGWKQLPRVIHPHCIQTKAIVWGSHPLCSDCTSIAEISFSKVHSLPTLIQVVFMKLSQLIIYQMERKSIHSWLHPR